VTVRYTELAPGRFKNLWTSACDGDPKQTSAYLPPNPFRCARLTRYDVRPDLGQEKPYETTVAC